MKEIKTHGDQYGKCYEINVDGYTKNFVDDQSALDYLSYYHNIDYGETTEERMARVKSERRNNRIDELLNDTK